MKLRIKKLILILLVCGTIASCSKKIVKGCTDPYADNHLNSATVNEGCTYNSLLGLYTGARALYKDENLTIADGTPTPDSKNEIKFINNKYVLIIKTTKDTLYLTNIKTFSKKHIAFSLETTTTKTGTVYESLKKYTYLGGAYSGRYQKGTKENLLLYFKATIGTFSTYAKFDGNK